MNSSGQNLASGYWCRKRNYNNFTIKNIMMRRYQKGHATQELWIKSLYQVKTCSINFKTQQMDPHSSCTHPNGQWFRQLAVHMGGVCYACGRVKVKFRNLFCYNHSRRISSFLVNYRKFLYQMKQMILFIQPKDKHVFCTALQFISRPSSFAYFSFRVSCVK